MDWLLGLLFGAGLFLLCIKDKPELLDLRLQKKADIHQKIVEMLHIRKGFKLTECMIKFPFSAHPSLAGIAIDQQAKQICLISGDFEKQETSVRLISYHSILECELLVDGLSLLFSSAKMPANQSDLEQTASVKLPDTHKIKSVLLRLTIRDAKYPQHQIEFIEKAKGDGGFALQDAKKWHLLLTNVINKTV